MVYSKQTQITVRSNFSVTNIYKKKNIKSEIVTQLIYGDNFKITKRFGSWVEIRNNSDNYKGYIKKKPELQKVKNIQSQIDLTDFEKIVNMIKEKNMSKSYPDINNIPN